MRPNRERNTTHAPSQHHVAPADHDALKVGTLNAILREIADHYEATRDALLQRLFD